tara:strand:+ start:9195 stop:10916 length:1722 start_codon:yes stop_codon:yes gene_type:complete
MGNEATINRLANYQMISDLLGTFLDAHQKEREMMMKYGTKGKDTERRIIKENNVNYYADDGTRVLDVPIEPKADGKRELYQWEDPVTGQVMSGTFEEAEAAEQGGSSYYKMGTFSDKDDATTASDPQLYQWKDAAGNFGQGTFKEAEASGLAYVKMPTGFAQETNKAGEQMYAWDNENGEYTVGNIDEAQASGQPFGKMSTYTRPTAASAKENMILQDGVWYDLTTKQPVLGNVTTVGNDVDNKGVHFDLKSGKMYYYDKKDPETLQAIDIPGWTATTDGTKTRVISSGGRWQIINEEDGQVVFEGVLPEAAGESSDDRRKAANDYIQNYSKINNLNVGPSKNKLDQLYGIIKEDPDISKDDLTQYKALADDIGKGVKDTRKKTRQTTLGNYAKFVNQSMFDKFGSGPGGQRTTINMGAGFEYTIATGSSKEKWTPDRAANTLARIKAHQTESGTGMGYMTQDEGGALIADVFVSKSTDYGTVKSGHQLKGSVMTNTSDKTTVNVTPITDINGNKYAYGPNKELFYYDADNGGVYRKVKGDLASYTIDNSGKIVTTNASKWFLEEMKKYKYID